MRDKRSIRIIKRETRATADNAPETPSAERPAPTEREIKTVVSGWVHEHARRSDDFRRTFSKLLTEMGFEPSRLTGRA
jgi:hypothetical protein